MTTTRERLAALDAIALERGKTREEILRAVAPSWRLGFPELSRLREEMARTPEPKPARAPTNGNDPRALADREHARSLADRTVADIAAFRSWRDLKAANPHAAALLLNRNADAIQRGRTLDAPTDDGPPGPQAA